MLLLYLRLPNTTCFSLLFGKLKKKKKRGWYLRGITNENGCIRTYLKISLEKQYFSQALK